MFKAPSSFVFLVLVSASSTAFAATRTICADIKFIDNRSSANCATTSETANLRGCSPGNNVEHVGFDLELWDKDADGTDELIVTSNYPFAGGTCWTFEWDNNASANAEHEANPDVYVSHNGYVSDTGRNRFVRAVDPNGNNHNVNWRNGPAGSPDAFLANECTGTCWVAGGGTLLPSSDASTDVGLRAMALDSAQHYLQAFQFVMTQSVVNMRIPTSTGCGAGNGGACTISRGQINVNNTVALDGTSVAHELGHTLQEQRFGQDALVDDCAAGGAGWSITGTENDSCAVTEGWATFVAGASWYDPNTTNASPALWGVNFESASWQNATCSANRGIPLQSTKGFWDMADSTNEAGAGGQPADNQNWFSTWITQGWGQFPNGTADRQNDEASVHGVNMFDFFTNTNVSMFSSAAGVQNTLINHNCTQTQAP
jgi:hypothetical protein